MATIFHIALADDWEDARATGTYTVSTLGRSLADVGFIHCSRGDQWTKVRDAIYADATEPLVLLQIDTALLDVPVVDEPGEPGSSETFPHVYGRLPAAAVVKAIPLAAARPARAEAPVPAPGSAAPTAPAPSFSALFLGEMFANAALVILVIVGCVLGLLVGSLAASDVALLIGALAGAAIGGIVARSLYVRRVTRTR